ncbi:uncharacterized protein LOC114752338 isoform X3 [Neltuma alba]|uniref:uncharacterized protein LOC114752338 isoform X3 n=1 Tax=Neltuma alba TaxID=207710 RepID=UPI0010A43185|nr:uncharacterized protein LOC114752338 isoform X3 [Prosopis alba]
MHQSGNPLSSLGESVCPQSGSNCIPDSLNWMPHAFSDSKLHESGLKSGYCSQEGVGQFSSLNLSVAQLSSMLSSNVSQRDPVEIQHDPLLIYPQRQSKIPNVEPERQCGDNTVKTEIMKRMEDKSSLQTNESNLYERESPAVAIEHVNDLHILDSSPASNSNIKINQLEQSYDGMISASSCLTGISQNNLIEKTPSNFLDMRHGTSDGRDCGLTEGLNGGLGFDFSWTRKSSFNASSLKCEGTSSGKTSPSDCLFDLSMDPVSRKSTSSTFSQGYRSL